MKALALLLLLPVGAMAQTVDIRRLGASACECQTDAGVRLSGHTSDLEGVDACADLAFRDGLKKRLVCSYELSVMRPVVVPPPPPMTGNASLTWTLPTLSVDGTPIKPITGFDIEYSLDPLNFVQAVVVPLSTAYTVPGLALGTWYFRMRTITATDGKSGWTNLASLTI